MAKKISNKKPLSGNLVSHAENRTRTKQNPNLQTYKINGVKVRLTARKQLKYQSLILFLCKKKLRRFSVKTILMRYRHLLILALGLVSLV